jgi:hypothetical protein
VPALLIHPSSLHESGLFESSSLEAAEDDVTLAGLGRHFQGWQLAVVAVGTALGGVALALPRPVAPCELPLPDVDRVEEAAATARARELVRAATVEPLPFLVRAAGDTFRRFGAAEAKGDVVEAGNLAVDFERHVSEARARHGDGPILSLRAVQADLFARAVKTNDIRELTELGGSLLAAGDRPAFSPSLLSPEELGSLFEMRWTRLSGLIGSHPFLPSSNAWRLYYRTLLANPDLASHADGGTGLLKTARFVEAVARRDPEYPRLVALGVIEQWMGRYEAAEALYIGYLATYPSGRFRLRAQNYMLAARSRLPASPRP